MANRYFFDRLGLSYILAVFPAASILILLHRPITTHLARYHWLAYWLTNAVWLLQAWQIVNHGESWRLYRNDPWWRKLVGAAAFPLALVIANVLFLWLLEGYSEPGGIVVFLFVVLGIAAGATGFVGTRERPIGSCTKEDLEQARRIHKGCMSTLVGMVLLLLGSSLFEPMKQFYLEIWQDWRLFIGGLVIVLALVISFVVYPWIIVRTMSKQVNQEKPPSS